jgi:hypothetical protein
MNTEISPETQEVLDTMPQNILVIDSLMLCSELLQWLDVEQTYCVMRGIEPNDELPTTDEMEKYVSHHIELLQHVIKRQLDDFNKNYTPIK